MAFTYVDIKLHFIGGNSETVKNLLFQALTFWEIATEVILDRESLMTKLEDFERTASDPNRFFSKGKFR